MYYGDGLPPSVAWFGQRVNYLAGALDIVAHELTHGVTDYSSAPHLPERVGGPERGVLRHHGDGRRVLLRSPTRADYLLGEDVFIPGGMRSMQNPQAYGDPDHYSIRYTGTGDNGGVHINSGIANNAFYLAIEGGTPPARCAPSRAWAAPTARRSSVCSTAPSRPS